MIDDAGYNSHMPIKKPKPGKECPSCNRTVGNATRICPDCEHEFRKPLRRRNWFSTSLTKNEQQSPAFYSAPSREDPSRKSSFYEKLVEHVFISEVLQEVWYRFGRTVEVLRSEVDASGYDVVFECNGIVRHVQLKTSAITSKTARQKVNIALADKPSGCIVWIVREEDRDTHRMTLSYRFFGNNAGSPLPSLAGYSVARHTKGNKDGVKAERPFIRVVPKGDFIAIDTITELVARLFGLGDK